MVFKTQLIQQKESKISQMSQLGMAIIPTDYRETETFAQLLVCSDTIQINEVRQNQSYLNATKGKQDNDSSNTVE